jgi:hypothetical protein
MSMAIAENYLAITVTTKNAPQLSYIAQQVRDLVQALEKPGSPDLPPPEDLMKSLKSLLHEAGLDLYANDDLLRSLKSLREFRTHLDQAITESTLNREFDAITPDREKLRQLEAKQSIETATQAPDSYIPDLDKQINVITQNYQSLTRLITQNLRDELRDRVNQKLVDDFIAKNQDAITKSAHLAYLQNTTNPQAAIRQAVKDFMGSSRIARQMVHLVQEPVEQKVAHDFQLSKEHPVLSPKVIDREIQSTLSPHYNANTTLDKTARAKQLIEAAALTGNLPRDTKAVQSLFSDPRSGIPKELAENPRFQQALLAHAQTVPEALNKALAQSSKVELTNKVADRLVVSGKSREVASRLAEKYADLVTPTKDRPAITADQAAREILGANTNPATITQSPDVVHANANHQAFLSSPQNLPQDLSGQILNQTGGTLNDTFRLFASHPEGSLQAPFNFMAISSTQDLPLNPPLLKVFQKSTSVASLNARLGPNPHPQPPILNRLFGEPIINFAPPSPGIFGRWLYFTSSPSRETFGWVFRPLPQNYSSLSPRLEPSSNALSSLRTFFGNPLSVFGGPGITPTADVAPTTSLLDGANRVLNPTGITDSAAQGGLGNLLHSLSNGLGGLRGLGPKALLRFLPALGGAATTAWWLIPVIVIGIILLALVFEGSQPASMMGLALNEQIPIVGAQLTSSPGIIVNPFIGITKTATPNRLTDPVGTVTYTYTITAKQGALTNVTITDKTTLVQKSGAKVIPLTHPTPPPNIDSSWTSDPFTLTLDNSMDDAAITNTITVTATAPDGSTQQTNGSATVLIGNPPAGCYVLADGPSPGPGITVVGWHSSGAAEIAFNQVSAILPVVSSFFPPNSPLCNQGPVNIYLASSGLDVNYGGYVANSSSIVIDFKFHALDVTYLDYLIAHESGHIYDLRYPGISGGAFKNAQLVSWNGASCINNIYPLASSYINSDGACYGENFAEGVGRYIGPRAYGALAANWYAWFSNNVFR